MYFEDNHKRPKETTALNILRLLKKALFLAVGIALCGEPVMADPVTAAGEVLKINPDPLTSSMGGGILSQHYSPSSIFANPASAAQFSQSRFSFSSSRLEEDMNYQFAGFVLPTGIGNFTAAAAMLSYGDIQGYDAAGASYDIVSSQDQVFALNYSLSLKKLVPVERRFGSIGLTVKGITSSLAGYSASGLAFDAGCIFKIYDPWSLSGGFAFKNFGKSLNYFKTDNVLPSSVDAAIKYENGEFAELTGVLNASRSWPDELYTYSAGASMTPLYPVSVRVGWQQTQNSLNTGLRGGLGLDFSNVSLNYSIEPFINFSMIQKISVDVAFGGITDPTLAYDYYLNRNFERARDSYLRGDYIIARQRFEEILALYPNHQPSKDYLTKIALSLEDVEKENQQKIEKYLIKGRVALQRRDLLKSSRCYGMVLGLDPLNAAALEGKKKTDELRQKLEDEENRKANEKKIIELWSEATSYAGRSDYVSSREKINELLAIDPQNEEAKKYLAQINSKLENISGFQLNDMYMKGVALYNEGKYSEAMKYFDSVLLASPKRLDAKNYSEACKKKMQEQLEKSKQEKPKSINPKMKRELEGRYQSALKLYDSGQYDTALKAFSDLQKSAEDAWINQYSERAKTYVAKIKAKSSEKSFNTAQGYAEKGDLESAYNEYAKALKSNPDFKSAKQEQDKVGELLSRKYYERGAKEFSEGNMVKAKENFRKSIAYKKDNIESQRALERIGSAKSPEGAK